MTFAEWANAVLSNGLGNYDKAAAAALRACSYGRAPVARQPAWYPVRAATE